MKHRHVVEHHSDMSTGWGGPEPQHM